MEGETRQRKEEKKEGQLNLITCVPHNLHGKKRGRQVTACLGSRLRVRQA